MIEIVFSLTIIWLVGTFFLLIGYDIYAVTKNKPTISWIVFNTSRRWPVIPFLVGFMIGFLMGHLFFPVPVPIGQ